MSKVEKSIRVTVDEVVPEEFEVILTKGNKQLIVDNDYDLIATREGEHYSDFDEYILNLERDFDTIWVFLKNHCSTSSAKGEDNGS